MQCTKEKTVCSLALFTAVVPRPPPDNPCAFIQVRATHIHGTVGCGHCRRASPRRDVSTRRGRPIRVRGQRHAKAVGLTETLP